MDKEISSVVIRKFQTGDRDEVRRIVCATAMMGEPCHRFFDGDEVFADAISRYFTDHEPESIYVAQVNATVIGCVFGAKDVAVMSKIFGEKLALWLVLKALKQGVFYKKKNIIFFGKCLWGAIQGEFRCPDLTKEYPAVVHINIKEGYRGLDIGSRLMHAYLEYLKGAHVRGVHLATMSDKAGNFFAQNGFKLLFSGKRSYFRHILYKDVPLYMYGLKLK